MTPITCIIVDDEPLAVKLLESFVAKTPQLQLLASFTDSVEALSFLRDHPVQLAFMDIQMPDMNGMELSHMLPERTKVIFTTAFKGGSAIRRRLHQHPRRCSSVSMVSCDRLTSTIFSL